MNTSPPIGSASVALARLGVLGVLLAACAQEPHGVPAPPLPADMSGFDAAIVEQIRSEVDELERDPGNATRWRYLGMLYQAHDQIELAVECYRWSRSLDPDPARTHFYLALAEQRSGRLAEAIAEMRQAAELDAGYAPARWRLGLLLLEEGKVTAALDTLQEALTLAPDDPAVHHALGRAQLQAEAADEAAALLEGWLEGHPDDRYAHLLLGTAYRRLGRPEAAQHQLVLGQGAQPSWSDPWSRELEAKRAGFPARLATATGLLEEDPVQAVARLEQLRRDRPDNATVLINLGIGYRRTGRLGDSTEALREAVRLEPARGLAHFHLALTYSESSGRAESREAGSDLLTRALEHAERTVELQPTSPRSHAMHGELLVRAGRMEAAVEAYGRAVTDPQDPAWLHRLGGLLCQLGRWSQAIPVLESYLERTGEDVEGLLLLGVAQANAGRPEAARATLERALAISPGEPRVEQALAELEAYRRTAGRRQGSGG